MQTTKRSFNEASQLTENQIGFFKQEGYLVLRDFLDTSLLETWREQFWVQAGGSLEDKDSWPASKNIGNLKLTPESLSPTPFTRHLHTYTHTQPQTVFFFEIFIIVYS